MTEESTVIELPRGGHYVQTRAGPVQVGIPPETIKDSMILGLEIPTHYIVPTNRFIRDIGPNAGTNVAEFEFPAYCNFFFKRKKVNLIVSSPEVEQRIRIMFQETLFGPLEIDPDVDFSPDFPEEKRPDLAKELKYFRKFGDTEMTIDMLLSFTHFDVAGRATVTGSDGESVRISRSNGEFTFTEDAKVIACVADRVTLPPPKQAEMVPNFHPPLFGVTVLGSSHGFDPTSSTSGYVLWINKRGIMIDPPPNSTTLLLQNHIPPAVIDGVIVTHCHADHDAGTFQKILQEGRVTLLTTPTIMGSFLRKYSALSGLDQAFLKGVFQFRPVRIGEAVKMRGAEFRFFYSLHSIPCIGFQVFFGGQSAVFSADHMNDPEKVRALGASGVLSPGRMNSLLNFPWHRDLILHEAGVPPIHTPMATLAALPDDVKSRLYLVHVSKKDVPADSGLRVAAEGVRNTLVLPVERPVHSDSVEVLDLVSSLDVFSSLSIRAVRELLQIAQRKRVPAGQFIIEKGQPGDAFYVVASGVCDTVADTHFSSARRSVRASSMGGGPGVDLIVAAAAAAAASINEEEEENEDGTATAADSTAATAAAGPAATAAAADGSGSESGSEGGDDCPHLGIGDYFGEEVLVNIPSVSYAKTVLAVTDVDCIMFDRANFMWLLQGTGIVERMRRLSLLTSSAAWGVLARNSVFQFLTDPQKKQLLEHTRPRVVRKGAFVWQKGNAADAAYLVEKGTLEFDGAVPRTRRPSQSVFACAVPDFSIADGGGKARSPTRSSRLTLDSVLQEEGEGGEKEGGDSDSSDSSDSDASNSKESEGSNGSRPSSARSSGSRGVGGGGSRLAPIPADTVLEEEEGDAAASASASLSSSAPASVPRGTAVDKPGSRSGKRRMSYRVREVITDAPRLRDGAFIGDMDALLSATGAGRPHGTSLRALETCILLELTRDRLLRFFSKNPGVLLSVLHTHYVL